MQWIECSGLSGRSKTRKQSLILVVNVNTPFLTLAVILRFCMLLENPMNGNVTFNTEFNSQATYTCDPEFDLVGNDTRTCQADRSWSGEEPICKCELMELLR